MSANSKAEAEVHSLKRAAESALADGSDEKLIDILEALDNVYMTVEILKSTMIGLSVANIKKTYSSKATGDSNSLSTKIAIKSKSIVSKWKSCVAPSTAVAAAPKPLLDVNISATISAISATKPDGSNDPGNSSLSSSSSIVAQSSAPLSPRAGDFEALYNSLPSNRIKMVDNLAGSLALGSSDASVTRFIACLIEESVNECFDHEGDKRRYIDKIRGLSYNLKQNEKIRKDLIDGTIQPSRLVHMTANELATSEMQKARESVVKEKSEEKDSNIFAKKREEIQKANGIDPNKGGEFKCSKCKSTKTVHTEKQTRSSDEPMTVFVQCLNCNARWRF